MPDEKGFGPISCSAAHVVFAEASCAFEPDSPSPRKGSSGSSRGSPAMEVQRVAAVPEGDLPPPRRTTSGGAASAAGTGTRGGSARSLPRGPGGHRREARSPRDFTWAPGAQIS